MAGRRWAIGEGEWWSGGMSERTRQARRDRMGNWGLVKRGGEEHNHFKSPGGVTWTPDIGQLRNGDIPLDGPKTISDLAAMYDLRDPGIGGDWASFLTTMTSTLEAKPAMMSALTFLKSYNSSAMRTLASVAVLPLNYHVSICARARSSCCLDTTFIPPLVRRTFIHPVGERQRLTV